MIDRQVIGHYELRELLGSGGIGEVYAALDQDLGRTVALKALRPEFSNDPSFVERFRSEAASLARLHHQNITTLFSLHREGPPERPRLFMVMELVHGRTLESILARSGRLSNRASLAVVAQTVAGLGYAHRMGVIHRDIKPSNLMVTESGLLKIMDFGIARVRGSQRLTREGAIVGTLAYVSPEQIQGAEGDERSDLYSLACVVYEMLSGNTPFHSDSEYELIRAHVEQRPEPLTKRLPDLPPEMEKALLRALSKSPDERFASVDLFAQALGAAAIQGDAVSILRSGLLDASSAAAATKLVTASEFGGDAGGGNDPRRPRRSAARASGKASMRGPAVALAGVAALLAAGGGYFAFRHGPADVPDAVRSAANPAGSGTRTDAFPGAPSVATASAPAAGSASTPAPDGAPAPVPEPASAATVPPSTLEATPSAKEAASPPPPAVGEALREAMGAGRPATPAAAPAPAEDAGPRVAMLTPGPTGPAAPEPALPPDADWGQTVRGEVEAYAADGWPIVGGKVIRMAGIEGLSAERIKRIGTWVAAHGNYLVCDPVTNSTYRCLTRQSIDVAQAVLLNGAARASIDAPQIYRNAEQTARDAKRGIWK